MNKQINHRERLNIYIDIMAILPFALMIFTGIILQINYHMKAYDPVTTVMGLNKSEWLLYHKIFSAVGFSLAAIHLTLHYKWLLGVFRKKLFISGSKPIKRTFRLLISFTIVSLTGLIPWLMGMTGETRHLVIEIHDKAAIFMSIMFIYHFAVRHNKIPEYLHKLRNTNELKPSVE